jgi:alpha-beta hydrolase superfamily lysophospholipase
LDESASYQTFNGHRIFTAVHGAGSESIVVFCHGFQGTTNGPRRLFVRLARELADRGIGSLRFDQYGSGNSEGDFIDSSFDDWHETANAITEQLLAQDRRVALLGQSMGANAAIVVASRQLALAGLVAWVPQPGLNKPQEPPHEILELDGQRVRGSYYHEVHDARIAERLATVQAPGLIIQCTADEYIDARGRDAIRSSAPTHHTVMTCEGYLHSSWTVAQADEVCKRSLEFLTSVLG